MKYVLLDSSSLEAWNFGRGILRLSLCLAPVRVVFCGFFRACVVFSG